MKVTYSVPLCIKGLNERSAVVRCGPATSIATDMPFTISGTDNQGFVQSISPASLTLAGNQSANVTVQLQAPTGTAPAISDTLTLTAVGSGSRATNFAVLTNVVGYSTTAPAITALSPKMGPVGSTVTITGTGFRDTQGAGVVTFNGVSAGAATTWSAGTVTVVVPSGATTGNVVITVGGVASNGVSFKVH